MTSHMMMAQLAVNVSALSALVLFSPPLQTASSGVVFEVASVRENITREVSPFNASTHVAPGGRVIATNLTLRELVRDALGFQHQSLRLVTGGPAWLDSERYDI